MRPYRFLVLLLCGLGLTLPALADEAADASAFANHLGSQALEMIANKSLNAEQKRKELEALFEKNVDIDWIGQFVLGRHWRGASDEQKQHYLANYRAFLIKHYTSNLTEFSDAQFEVTKVTPDDRGGQTVTMHIQRPGAQSTIVDYTVRRKNGQFKVYDIIVEGVSMITTQRSEFGSVASQKGIDYLISQLEKRSHQEESGKRNS